MKLLTVGFWGCISWDKPMHLHLTSPDRAKNLIISLFRSGMAWWYIETTRKKNDRTPTEKNWYRGPRFSKSLLTPNLTMAQKGHQVPHSNFRRSSSSKPCICGTTHCSNTRSYVGKRIYAKGTKWFPERAIGLTQYSQGYQLVNFLQLSQWINQIDQASRDIHRYHFLCSHPEDSDRRFSLSF